MFVHFIHAARIHHWCDMHAILCDMAKVCFTYTYMCIINVISDTYVYHTTNVNKYTETRECVGVDLPC